MRPCIIIQPVNAEYILLNSGGRFDAMRVLIYGSLACFSTYRTIS